MSTGLPNTNDPTTLVLAPGAFAHDERSASPSPQSPLREAVDEAAHNVFSSAQPEISAASNQSGQERSGRFTWLSSIFGSGAQSASGEGAVVPEPSRSTGWWSRISNAAQTRFSSSSRTDVQHSEHSSGLSDSPAGDDVSGSSANLEPGTERSVAREIRNREKKAYNAALEAAITDIKNPTGDLPENAEGYLHGVPGIYMQEAGSVIDAALQAAKAVRSNSHLNKSQLINQLDDVGNELKTQKKLTDSRLSNAVSDLSKGVGNLASYDVHEFFNRKYSKMEESLNLDNRWDRAGVFKKIAKLALYDFPGNQILKDLNGYIHDTSKSAWLRGGATIVATIAVVASTALSFVVRGAILTVAATAQVLVYRKVLPSLVVLGGIGAGLYFGGVALAGLFASGTIGMIIGSNICTGLSVLAITIGAVAFTYFKLKNKPQDQANQSLERLSDADFAALKKKLEDDAERRRKVENLCASSERLRNGGAAGDA